METETSTASWYQPIANTTETLTGYSSFSHMKGSHFVV